MVWRQKISLPPPCEVKSIIPLNLAYLATNDNRIRPLRGEEHRERAIAVATDAGSPGAGLPRTPNTDSATENATTAAISANPRY